MTKVVRKPDLLGDPVGATLFRTTVPTTLGAVAVILYYLADTWFVAQLGTDELAALGFTFPATILVTYFGVGLGIGTSALVAQALGSNKVAQARDMTMASLLIAMLIGCICMFPAIAGIQWLFPLLIFGIGPFPALGMAGAAWATVTAWACTVLAIAYHLWAREKLLEFRLPAFISQNHGARAYQRVLQGLRLSLRFVLQLQFALYVLVALTAPWIAGIFTSDVALRELITLILYILPASYAFQGMVVLSASSFNALHAPRNGFLTSLTRFFVFYVPLALLGNALWGLPGLFVGAALGNVLAGLLVSRWILRYVQGLGADSTAAAG